MQTQVKIISFTATKFGIFKAFELDFSQFKQGVLAIKGKSGEGKSTVQKALKLTTQGRDTLQDAEQYGAEWVNEIQLLDGDRKIFIQAIKKEGETPDFILFEKDENGKKVNSPIIDGVKATPAKYFDLLSTELTFGVKEFLSESETVHKKFMFKLFAPELNKLGVEKLKAELDELTNERDRLRDQCQNSGAFAASFERDGYTLDQIGAIEPTDIEKLESRKNELLISKGKASGDAIAEYEKKKAEIAQKGANIVNECRAIIEQLTAEFKAKEAFNKEVAEHNSKIDTEFLNFKTALYALSFVDDAKKQDLLINLTSYKNSVIKKISLIELPKMPLIENNKIIVNDNIVYDSKFTDILNKRKEVAIEYNSLKEPEATTKAIDNQIAQIESQITAGNFNNKLLERYELNRRWVDSCGKVEVKRNEIAKLYAQVSTGVEGLKMTPFYNKEDKIEIKTTYDGSFDVEYFKNPNKENRLLVSYSSSQQPLIGVLLQVARLKLKGKYLPYIFLDDIPLDKKCKELIARIAEENNLTILTSMTGDFNKENLEVNEMLIEGGEVFFS